MKDSASGFTWGDLSGAVFEVEELGCFETAYRALTMAQVDWREAASGVAGCVVTRERQAWYCPVEHFFCITAEATGSVM